MWLGNENNNKNNKKWVNKRVTKSYMFVESLEIKDNQNSFHPALPDYNE